MELGPLEDAIARGDHRAALELALELWRIARYAALADLIDALDAQLPEKARQQFRIEELEREPADPRIAGALFDRLASSRWPRLNELESLVVCSAMLRVIGSIGDVRVIAKAEKLIERPRAKTAALRAHLAERLPETIRTIERQLHARAPIDPLDEEKLIALSNALQPAHSVEPSGPAAIGDELLRAIYEDPDDDSAREVYSDWLLERGDPRGEFIALQFIEARGDATEKQLKRMRSLQNQHHASWIGDALHAVLGKRIFKKGMLYESQLRHNAAAERDVWEEASRAPQLATMVSLAKGRGNESLYRAFVLSEHMRGLRALEVVSQDMMREVCERPRRFERLDLLKAPSPTMLKMLPSPNLESLRVLSFVADRNQLRKAIEHLRKSPLLSQLRRLVLRANFDTDHALWMFSIPELQPVPEMELDLGEASSIVVRREARGFSVEVEYKHDFGLAAILRMIPGPIVDFAVKPRDGSDPHPAIVAALKEQRAPGR